MYGDSPLNERIMPNYLGRRRAFFTCEIWSHYVRDEDGWNLLWCYAVSHLLFLRR